MYLPPTHPVTRSLVLIRRTRPCINEAKNAQPLEVGFFGEMPDVLIRVTPLQ